MRMLVPALTLALLVGTFPAAARGGDLSGAPAEGEIYGGELMTPLEQDAYRRRMWELRTEAERERFRHDHHERMRERARDMGILLPDDPVRLDRPFFEDPARQAPGESRPDDGLRRWTSGEKEERPGALRRWPDGRESGEEEERSSGRQSGEDEETRSEEGRRWPPRRRPALRPESGSAEKAEPHVPPGAGRMDR